MSSGKSNGTATGRMARQQPTSTRNTASPLTPRLAANATTTKREPSPRRPFVKGTGVSRNPSPENRAGTPLRTVAVDNITPRSSARKNARPASTVSTPGSTISTSSRARTVLGTSRSGAQSPASDAQVRQDGRIHALQSRGGSTLSPLSQDPIVLASQNVMDDVTIKNPSSMFFHADDAKPTEHTNPVTTTTKKATTFFYANGQTEDGTLGKGLRATSPAMSMFGERRPLVPVKRGGTSELGISSSNRPILATTSMPMTSMPITSPTLSAISSARSPFVTSPNALSPTLLSPSPPKTDYLNTPHATLNHQRLRREWSPEPSTPMIPIADALGLGLVGEPSLSSTRSSQGQSKRSSVCAISVESPNSQRKRSATWAEIKSEIGPLAFTLEPRKKEQPSNPTSPTLPRANTASSLTSPIISDPLQSPSREAMDYANDARRERKVLDLEISNSSLLAINRSLEREVKKQKAELKSYRRLSRAGRFSVLPGDDLDVEDGLPHVDGGLVGRPSSPFEEDVSDMSLSESNSSEDEDLSSPGARASKEERRRAKDEAQLRHDLRKHRELLLDTARMNRSLQRCLTWTDDLIKDGKKALDRHVPSSEVKLGGRVLEADDDDDEEDEHLDSSGEQADAGYDDHEDGDFSGIEAFLGMAPSSWHRHRSDRHSTGSQETNRDSGVEVEKLGRQPPPPTSAGLR